MIKTSGKENKMGGVLTIMSTYNLDDAMRCSERPQFSFPVIHCPLLVVDVPLQ